MTNVAASILIWSMFGASAFVFVMCLVNLLFFRKSPGVVAASEVVNCCSRRVGPASNASAGTPDCSEVNGGPALRLSHPTGIHNVSVLIPARNEALRIGPLIDSVLSSEGICCEICVLDDESQDGTDSIVLNYSREHANVRLIRGIPVPAGWSGKQFACWQLAQHASFAELVFLDADVALTPDALLRAVRMRQQAGVDLLSGFPHQRVGTIGEQLLIPLIHLILLCFLPFGLMRWTRMTSAAAGCGQFFITTKHAYELSGGHSSIRQSLHDGIMLPRAFRRSGLMTDLFDASDLASCRMYTSFAETWSGLLKNAGEGFAKMPLLVVMTALMLLAFVSPVLCLMAVAAGWISSTLVIPIGTSCVLSYLPRIVCCWRFDRAWLACLLNPVAIMLFLLIQWTSLLRKRLGKSVQWRQRSYEIATS